MRLSCCLGIVFVFILSRCCGLYQAGMKGASLFWTYQQLLWPWLHLWCKPEGKPTSPFCDYIGPSCSPIHLAKFTLPYHLLCTPIQSRNKDLHQSQAGHWFGLIVHIVSLLAPGIQMKLLHTVIAEVVCLTSLSLTSPYQSSGKDHTWGPFRHLSGGHCQLFEEK